MSRRDSQSTARSVNSSMSGQASLGEGDDTPEVWHSAPSSSATLTTERRTTASVMSASKYVQAKSEDEAIELCNDLRRAFVEGRDDHDRERTGRRTIQALETFENALKLDSAQHPFASVAPIELTSCIAALLTFVDEDADGFATSVRERAESALQLMVQRAASPREVHHAMLVRMSRVGKQVVEMDQPETAEDHIDKSCALHEMAVLIRLQAVALPRIKTKRMASFIRALSNATRNGLARLQAEDYPPGHRIPRITEATVVGAIAELIHAIIELEPHDTDVLEILRDYLLHTLAQVASSPPLAAVLAEKYFREQHARFAERLFARDPGTREADAEAWTTVKIAARELKLGTQGLFSLASRHDMPPPGPPRFVGLSLQDQAPAASLPIALPDARARTSPPMSSQGAFVLLAHLLADREEQEGLIGGWYALRCTLPHILASLSGSGGTAIDEALFWLFWCFDHGLNAREGRTEEVDEATLYPVLEILSNVSATCAQDDTRFLAFRLLTTLLLDVLADRDDLQLLLITDLIDAAPYPFLRAAALGLLRDLIMERLTIRAGQKSLFSSPVLVTELGRQLLHASPPKLLQASLDTFIDDAHLQANAERLSLLYAALTADEHNKTSLRSPDRIRTAREQLIGPLRRAISQWTADGKTDPDRLNALGVLGVQLDLAEEAIKRFAK